MSANPLASAPERPQAESDESSPCYSVVQEVGRPTFRLLFILYTV
jgi:hypothetical protein